MEVIKDIKVEINKAKVFQVISLKENSPAYKESNELYNALVKEIRSGIFPKVIYSFSDKLEEKIAKGYDHSEKSMYVIITLGREITDIIDNCFKENLYLKGFLANTMADTMLFQLAKIADQYIYDIAKKQYVNLTQKLSPGDNIPIELQKMILQKIDPTGQLDISITDGYMLNPQKSSSWMYGVYTNQPLVIKSEHPCYECQNKNCLWRQE
ncbi:hypothetical protein SAMN05660297_03603 [Natronincola peptidivorans]|uniref:Vitamin B12 dependent methionine synthase, activation domain n=1 Tax=Natronincola peptidivorans TaxID=426128 RepID=A0A1I0HDA9_9FIRM|nr:hypothetical protein [Natronincola peptidivorans]SET81827.1 hypothetical protein SAMN05660297_03603 [Natronincola peptidivorans]